MKKFLLSILTVFLIVTLVACGTQTATSKMSDKIDYTLENMENSLKEIQTINENDILINEINASDIAAYTSIAVNPRRGTHSTRQVIDYSNQNANGFGYSETNAMRNVNSYNPYGRLHNVNSYQGLNQNFPNQINEINQAQYGNNQIANPNVNNGIFNGGYNNGVYGTGAYNNMPINRGLTNVNTYGLNNNNVNTYNPRLINQNENNEVLTNENVDNNQNSSNVDTYKPEQNNSQNYNNYANSENLKNHFTELSNLFSVASNVISVNKAINEEKNYINDCHLRIKELTKQLKEKTVELTADQQNSINNLLENINSNISKITLSKNEVRYELEKVKSLKNSYKNNSEQLTSRYVRLTNCLDTRYSYYCNVSSCLEQLITYLQTYVNLQPESANNTTTEQPSVTEQSIKDSPDFTKQNGIDTISINELIKQRRQARQNRIQENKNLPIEQNNIIDNNNQVTENNNITENQTTEQKIETEENNTVINPNQNITTNQIDERHQRYIREQKERAIRNFKTIPTPKQEVFSEEQPIEKIDEVVIENQTTDENQTQNRIVAPNMYEKKINEHQNNSAIINPFKEPKKNDFLSFESIAPKIKDIKRLPKQDNIVKEELKKPDIEIIEPNQTNISMIVNF